MTQCLQYDDYTIAWICAISIEVEAARSMLEEPHVGVFPELFGDDNVYGFAGRIGDSNIVIARLPEQRTGNVAAAILMTQIRRSFTNLKYAFMVGIGAGVPGANGRDPDIRLGDVVVAFPTDKSSGIVGYELGKETDDGFLRRCDSSYQLDRILQNTIALMKQKSEYTETNEFLKHLNTHTPLSGRKRRYGEETPYRNHDSLPKKVTHPSEAGLQDNLHDAETKRIMQREPRPNPTEPVVHYGAIASGDKLVKNSKLRERLRKEHGVLCIEMEGAGIRDGYPAAVIRGISDYADSHKNDAWQAYAAMVAAAYATEVIRNIPPRNINLVIDVSTSRADITEEERKACLESLLFEQIDVRLANIEKAHAKTCSWLYRRKEYTDWLDKERAREHHGFLWIKGKPGAGKSTIMKNILNSKRLPVGATIISFFFNARGSTLEKSVLGMYRSLLYQILKAIPRLQDNFVPIWLRKRGPNWDIGWTVRELRDFLETAVNGHQHQQRLVFLIDALDECKESEIRSMVETFESLGESSVSQNNPLLVCLASRHYPHVTIQRCIELVVEDQTGHNEDIEKYVQSKFKAPKGKAMDVIRADILQKASGVFLWVVLVVKILNEEIDHGQIHRLKKKLDSLPAELDDLFADILSRDNNRIAETTLCLQWLLFAKRPLTREELYFAVLYGLDPTALQDWDPNETESNNYIIQKFILSCSKGLAEVSKGKDRTVQFIHETVRGFFLSGNGLAKLDPNLEENMLGLSEDKLKICCYQCILTNKFDYVFETPLPKAKDHATLTLRKMVCEQLPFLEYAANNMFGHADTAHQTDVPQLEFVSTFKASGSLDLQRWMNFNNLFEHHTTRRYPSQVELLYVFSERGLANLIKALLHRPVDFNLNHQGGRYGSAIQVASMLGHSTIVELLINAGASINISGKYYPPLIGALSKSRIDVADILLEKGADVDWLGKEAKTTLHFAAAQGLITIVERLVTDLKANLDPKDENGHTPLHAAIMNGHQDVARFLLRQGAVMKRQFRDLRDYFVLACATGHEGIVEFLLENGADVNAQNEDHGNALQAASSSGKDGIVRLLLENGADVNAQGGYYGNALQAASSSHKVEIVKLLLENGADVNAQGGHYGNALQAASFWNKKGTVMLLLENGANVNAQGGHFGNALQAASSFNKDEIVRLLLENGADVNAQGGYYGNALQAASSYSKDGIVKLLLENGADVNVQGGKYKSALQAALSNEEEGVVKLLLEAGAL